MINESVWKTGFGSGDFVTRVLRFCAAAERYWCFHGSHGRRLRRTEGRDGRGAARGALGATMGVWPVRECAADQFLFRSVPAFREARPCAPRHHGWNDKGSVRAADL